jgi:SAM-dependent methyltransferase
MTSYAGRHADLYDVIYAGKDYRSEARFVHEVMQRHATGRISKALEIACGTGSHALQLQALGYEVTASDYSTDMLRVAGDKARRANARIRFLQQDMRRLDADLRDFDAVICLFDSIGYVQTNDGVMQVLRGVRNALRAGGLFVFEFWHAPPMLHSYDPVRVRRYPIADGELLRITETRLNVASQLATVEYELLELMSDGTYRRLREAQVNRFFELQEMGKLVQEAGLELAAAYAGFSHDQVIDESTWHIVAVAKKN